MDLVIEIPVVAGVGVAYTIGVGSTDWRITDIIENADVAGPPRDYGFPRSNDRFTLVGAPLTTTMRVVLEITDRIKGRDRSTPQRADQQAQSMRVYVLQRRVGLPPDVTSIPLPASATLLVAALALAAFRSRRVRAA